MSSADYATDVHPANGPGRKAGRISRRAGLRSGGTTAAVALAATAALTLAGPAGASIVSPAASHGYTFRTLDNHKDVTFNQLLGISNAGLISGYFGSGGTGHPNKGYLLQPGYHQRDYVNENFPHSAQTQVTGLNNIGNTVGFWVNSAGANFGFYTSGPHFHEVNFPKVPNSSPQVDQLLGINDKGVAVGFYTNSVLTAAAINNHGEVAGFYVTGTGTTVAFVKTAHTFTTLVFPHSSMTQAFGINDSGEVVGDYVHGTGKSAKMHGFTWAAGHGFKTVNDPSGVNTTTINGVNDHGDLVGFYVGSGGNTNGFLARPRG